MNPLELRKIVQVGYRFDNDGLPPLLDANGLPAKLQEARWWGTFAFWIPAPKPFQRCSGATKVVDARPFEVQALKDGAIIEHVQEFEFPKQPELTALRGILLPVWDALTAHSLGFVPNAPPIDRSEKMTIEFTPVKEESTP